MHFPAGQHVTLKKLQRGNRCEKFGPGFNSCTKAVLSATPVPTPKRCEPQLFLAALGQVIRCSKALDLGSLDMQFQHDCQEIKNYSSFNFSALKLRKISLD